MTIVHFHLVYLQICSYINVVIPFIRLVNTRLILLATQNTTQLKAGELNKRNLTQAVSCWDWERSKGTADSASLSFWIQLPCQREF